MEFRDVMGLLVVQGGPRSSASRLTHQPPHLARVLLCRCTARLPWLMRSRGEFGRRSARDVESRQRPLTRHTRRWTRMYGVRRGEHHISQRDLVRLRRCDRRFASVQAQLNKAAHHDPMRHPSVDDREDGSAKVLDGWMTSHGELRTPTGESCTDSRGTTWNCSWSTSSKLLLPQSTLTMSSNWS